MCSDSSSEKEIWSNKEKCQFENEQNEFYEPAFIKDWLKPSPDKVKTIKECSPPESKEAIWSFLRMAGYLENYISNYVAIAAPLYQLTRKDAKFKWEKEEEKAFRKIQDSISSDKNNGILWPIQTHNSAYRSKLQPRLISSPTAKDWQGYTASAIHQSHHDRNGKKI